MKKQILIFAQLIITGLSTAQQQIPNNDFEGWVDLNPYTFPISWGGLSPFTQMPYFFYTETPHSGDYALNLSFTPVQENNEWVMDAGDLTLGNEVIFYNDLLSENHIDNVYPGKGFSFSSRPDSLAGWYRYHNVDALQSQEYIVLGILTSWNTTSNSREVVAEAKMYGQPTGANYERESIEFVYQSNATPDTLRMYMAPIQCRYFSQHPLGWSDPTTLVPVDLWVDDLEMIYNSSAAITENSRSFTISPNPATDIVNIKSTSSIASIEILDLNGKVVLNVPEPMTQSEISIRELNAGVFICRVTTTSGFISQERIVKQ